jgi:hypothetical protein
MQTKSPWRDLQNPRATRILEPTECWGTWGLATDVGDEGNSHGWMFSDASHWVLFYGERSEPGEINTLAQTFFQVEKIAIVTGRMLAVAGRTFLDMPKSQIIKHI